jgi:hypothetical protein
MKITARGSRLAKTMIAASLFAGTFAVSFVALAQPGFADGLKYKPISVKTPDGLTISAQE